MFKCYEDQINVLGVCVDEPLCDAGFNPIAFHAMHEGRAAVQIVRETRFDLLLVGSHLPDVSVWHFLEQIRRVRAWQNWALVGGPLTEQQTGIARMFGAATLSDATPSTRELVRLVARLREKAIQNVLDDRFGQPVTYAAAG